MIFYNQNDYAHIPYPSAGFPNENIAEAGCGICSACMVVENLTGEHFSVAECAAFALASEARDDSGTVMEKLAPALCERFGLSFEATDDKEKTLAFLNAGEGMVIANPGGDREGHVGLFTTGGHYIVLSAARYRTVQVLDPSLSPTKFSKESRRNLLFVDGNNIYCDIDMVSEDCLNRSPAFFLFKKA